MTDKRYHVYISTAFEDVKAERLKLEYTLLNLGVFPWEFNERRTSLNTAQARRQIDDCDYVIFLVGGCYGDLSVSGISYTHLDFLYALNKNKTILSFVATLPEKNTADVQESTPEMSAKLAAFRELLQKDSHYYTTYSNTLELERAVRHTFVRAIQENPASGWIRPKNNDVLMTEVQRLRQKVTELEQSLIQAKNESSMMQRAGTSTEQQKVTISYRTHAYQDGNLKDLHPHRDVTWRSLLEVLVPHFSQPAQESVFLRVLNQYFESIALEDARTIMPRAHAVARTQIDTRCLQQIKLQMKWNNWIIPQPELGTGTRIFWKVTAEAERLLSKSKSSDATIQLR